MIEFRIHKSLCIHYLLSIFIMMLIVCVRKLDAAKRFEGGFFPISGKIFLGGVCAFYTREDFKYEMIVGVTAISKIYSDPKNKVTGTLLSCFMQSIAKMK